MVSRIPHWLRAGATGAVVAGAFVALAGVRVAVPKISLSCDHDTDRYCLGAAFGSVFASIVLFVAGLVVFAILLGWAVAALLRLRRSWAVALLGPVGTFAAAWLGATVHVQLFRPSPWAICAAAVMYGLAGLLVSRPPQSEAG